MRRFIKGLVYNFNRGGDGVLKFVGIMRGPWGPMGPPVLRRAPARPSGAPQNRGADGGQWGSHGAPWGPKVVYRTSLFLPPVKKKKTSIF